MCRVLTADPPRALHRPGWGEVTPRRLSELGKGERRRAWLRTAVTVALAWIVLVGVYYLINVGDQRVGLDHWGPTAAQAASQAASRRRSSPHRPARPSHHRTIPSATVAAAAARASPATGAS